MDNNIFTCDACRFTFVAPTLSFRCPDCGKQAVRPASSKEIEEYKRIRLEIAAEDEHTAEDKAANQ